MKASTSAAVNRPALTTTARTAPWWDAAAEGRLLIQRCTACGHTQHYPRALCRSCWSEDLEWIDASGKGTIWTFTVVHKPGHPAWAAAAPYTIALVELEEGPRMMSNIVGCAPEAVSVGVAVECEFSTEPGDPQPLPRFRLTST